MTLGQPLVPLTGRRGVGPSRPALVVKIDNAPKARPQAGVNEADIVVEEAVEGGVTRFFTLFHSVDAGAVGPVRSARSTDIALVGPLNRPLFAYSGANSVFLRLLREAPLIDVGVNAFPAAYRRERSRPAPYNLFSTTGALWSRSAGSAAPAPLFAYTEECLGEAVAGAHLEFRGRIQTIVDFAWDAASGGWKRTQDGTPHVDASGRHVAPENVVVLHVGYHDTGIRDTSGEPVPEADLDGSGVAWVMTCGRVVEGTWSKASSAEAAKLTDAQGKPIALRPGRTWIELARTDSNGTARLIR